MFCKCFYSRLTAGQNYFRPEKKHSYIRWISAIRTAGFLLRTFWNSIYCLKTLAKTKRSLTAHYRFTGIVRKTFNFQKKIPSQIWDFCANNDKLIKRSKDRSMSEPFYIEKDEFYNVPSSWSMSNWKTSALIEACLF